MFPTVNKADVDRWDREWMHYFATEDRSVFLSNCSRLSIAEDLSGRSPAEVFASHLVDEDGNPSANRLRIWTDGASLVDRNIVEIGCGCGWLGKRLGLICTSYLGIDYSEIALAIARGVSPVNCRYLHLSQREAIGCHAGTMDTMVGREFFIHQNFDNARWVLTLGAFLLKPGGVISADFYLPNPNVPQGVVHEARSPLDPQHASCAFYFQAKDVKELASLAALSIQSSTDDLKSQRRFVIFSKPGLDQ